MDGHTSELQPQTALWRYMDVARFLDLIDQKQLYFARLHELGDSWEGARSTSDPLFSGPDRESIKAAATS